MRVVEELRAAVGEKGKEDITEKYFIADMVKSGHDFAKFVEQFKDLHITVVVHVVGESGRILTLRGTYPSHCVLSTRTQHGTLSTRCSALSESTNVPRAM